MPLTKKCITSYERRIRTGPKTSSKLKERVTIFGISDCWVNEKGQFHRIGEPAVISKDGEFEYSYGVNMPIYKATGKAGFKEWFVNGLQHNENGPAYVNPEGKEEYYLFGCAIKKEVWEKAIKDRFLIIQGSQVNLPPLPKSK